MPGWMERYRPMIYAEGELIERWMNGRAVGSPVAESVRRQVALLIALREAGELVSAQKEKALR